jgi:signal transduction histidine kinase
VFSNLVSNAFKYTPPGGTVTVSVQAEDAWAVVSVDDEGEGIPHERLPRIFELFQRATTTGSGLGVGLAVVKALVTAHGGTVTAVSDGLGHGATFTVRLPLAHTDLEGGR